jgi:hypothetical protein
MSNKSTKGFNGTHKAKIRRKNVIDRLETQLKYGMKPPKKKNQTVSDIPLTDTDINRIKKELVILKNKF